MSKENWREFDNPVSKNTRDSSISPIAKVDLPVRVQRMKAGKKGKTITLIQGLGLERGEARILLKTMKSRCGTGGTVKENAIELQGDHVLAVIDFLATQGYRPKRVGG